MKIAQKRYEYGSYRWSEKVHYQSWEFKKSQLNEAKQNDRRPLCNQSVLVALFVWVNSLSSALYIWILLAIRLPILERKIINDRFRTTVRINHYPNGLTDWVLWGQVVASVHRTLVFLSVIERHNDPTRRWIPSWLVSHRAANRWRSLECRTSGHGQATSQQTKVSDQLRIHYLQEKEILLYTLIARWYQEFNCQFSQNVVADLRHQEWKMQPKNRGISDGEPDL